MVLRQLGLTIWRLLETVGDNLGKIKAVTPNTLKLDKLQKDHEFKYSKLDHKITREKNKTKRG